MQTDNHPPRHLHGLIRPAAAVGGEELRREPGVLLVKLEGRLLDGELQPEIPLLPITLELDHLVHCGRIEEVH